MTNPPEGRPVTLPGHDHQTVAQRHVRWLVRVAELRWLHCGDDVGLEEAMSREPWRRLLEDQPGVYALVDLRGGE